MRIKKLAASALAAVTAGATLGAVAFGQISTYVTTSGGTLTSPMIVIGSEAGDATNYPKDVVAAADLAAHVAGHATTPTVVEGGASSVSVTDGTSLDTPNQKLYLNNSIARAVQTLTSTELPVLLASGQVTTPDGDFEYDQFIAVGARTIQFGKSSEDIDPIVHVQLGTTVGSQAYTSKLVFNEALNVSDDDTAGEEINLFGGSYTISGDSVYGSGASGDDIVLFGSGTTVTMLEGEEITATVGGTSYTIALLGVTQSGSVDQAIVSVDGVSDDINEGASRKIGGLNIFAKDVFYLSKEAQVSSATLQLGAQKLLLNHGSEVKLDVDGEEETVDNTNVTITGTGEVSSVEIQVAAQDSDEDHVAVDTPYVDPVFGNFQIGFGGMTPAADSPDIDMFDLEVAGDDGATIQFTDNRGNTKTVHFGENSGGTLLLADSGADVIYPYEGANVSENEYLMVDSGEFGHLFEVSDIDPATASDEGSVTLKDIMSGNTIKKTLPTNDNQVEWIIDGQTYYLAVSDATTDVISMTWGTSATYNDVGSAATIFPLIETKQGAKVAFTDDINITVLNETLGLALGDSLELPGDPRVTFTVANVTDTGHYIVPANFSSAVPQVEYNLSITVNDIINELVIGIADPGVAARTRLTEPAILILEEEDDDDQQHAVIIDTSYDSSNDEIEWNEPTFTNTDAFSGISKETDTDVRAGIDEWGSWYEYDTDPDQPIADVWYPGFQSFATVAFGADPSFAVGGGGTVDAAVVITSPVAKLANEVNTATLSSDLVLVGGPCANTLVAELAAVENSTVPACDAWDLETGLIAEVSDAFGSGQKALVVAGTTADDTRWLAAQVMQGTLDYSV